MPPHKDDSHVVLQMGEQSTLAQFGLQDGTALPSHRIPTRVYKNTETGKYSMAAGDGLVEVRPLQGGKMVDLGAVQFFIKSILNSFLKQERYQHIDLDQIHLLVVQTSTRWSPLSIEKLINYLFEGLSLRNVSLVPLALCSMFAYGSYPNALVVDVGFEKTEILPIVYYELYVPASRFVPYGGQSINDSLKRLLPNLSDDQIEELKKSEIFQCLSDEDAKNSFFGMEGLVETAQTKEEDDEGVLDIASIVTSDKSTKEMLETAAAATSKKQSGDDKPNSELETNTFVDSKGNELTIGKERFQGCNELIDSIVFEIYWGLEKIPDPKKRQDVYENIIFSGQTTKIQGFKEMVMFKLAEKYLLTTHKANASSASSAPAVNGSQFRNNIIEIDDVNVKQAPRHLRLVPKPEYFISWKKQGLEDCSFLGAEILAKQVFIASNGLCLSYNTYQAEGPRAIWGIKL